MFGALALAAYDRRRAVGQLALDANGPDLWQRNRASEFLLQLGDRRGFSARVDALDSDQEAGRMFACRDVRVYSQQPLPCDANANASDRVANAAGWRAWWSRNERTFRVKIREAELDLQSFPSISPVSIGDKRVR